MEISGLDVPVVDLAVVHPGPSAAGLSQSGVEVLQVGVIAHPAHELETGPADRIDERFLGKPCVCDGDAGQFQKLLTVAGERVRVDLGKRFIQMVAGQRLAGIQVESRMVVHVDRRYAQHLQPEFGACCLARPEIADTGCLLSRFGDETGVKGDDIMAAAVLPNQSAVETHEIKWLSELDTVALFAIFAVPFQLLEIDPALYRKEQGHGLDHETILKIKGLL